MSEGLKLAHIKSLDRAMIKARQQKGIEGKQGYHNVSCDMINAQEVAATKS